EEQKAAHDDGVVGVFFRPFVVFAKDRAPGLFFLHACHANPFLMLDAFSRSRRFRGPLLAAPTRSRSVFRPGRRSIQLLILFGGSEPDGDLWTGFTISRAAIHDGATVSKPPSDQKICDTHHLRRPASLVYVFPPSLVGKQQ